MVEKSTSPWAQWELCPPDVATAALKRITDEVPMFFADTTLRSARWTALSFYNIYRLIEVTIDHKATDERAFLLDGNGKTWWLPGDSGPLYYVDTEEDLQLTEEQAADYLRFFCYFLRADEGAFAILESPDELEAVTPDDPRLEQAREGCKPLVVKETEENGRFLLDAAIAYGKVRAAAVFGVTPTVEVAMVDDG